NDAAPLTVHIVSATTWHDVGTLSDTATVAATNEDANHLCNNTAGPITINVLDNPPLAANDSYNTRLNATLNASATNGVLRNDSSSAHETHALTVIAAGALTDDTEVDGYLLTAATPSPISGPSHGPLTLNAHGSFTDAPAANFHGTDSFTYQATAGELNSNAA